MIAREKKNTVWKSGKIPKHKYEKKSVYFWNAEHTKCGHDWNNKCKLAYF